MDITRTFKDTKYDCLLFDLDDTLYPLSSGINLACRKKIEEFMLEHLHIDETEVPTMCLELYREYGTTMAGLKVLGYEFDYDEFHEYVHGSLPYENLKPDPLLRNILLSTPQRKIIFTNSDRAHVVRSLKKLGLEDCFEGVICFETLNPSNNPISKSQVLCKPSVEAIVAAMQMANLDPKRTIFFDDSTRNIASGKEAGLHTVIVGRSDLVAGADYALGSIHNMKEALPELWEPEAKEQLEQLVAVETAVLA
ncbi:uncharacterized protein C24B11.05 [Silene latifolia]|uniref:uncharacterized protein C24B11.05 n=1 Tax=Silene latifolia TaxID=37657 RepID=UPI003D770006